MNMPVDQCRNLIPKLSVCLTGLQYGPGRVRAYAGGFGLGCGNGSGLWHAGGKQPLMEYLLAILLFAGLKIKYGSIGVFGN